LQNDISKGEITMAIELNQRLGARIAHRLHMTERRDRKIAVEGDRLAAERQAYENTERYTLIKKPSQSREV
jgi:hypothetical protein